MKTVVIITNIIFMVILIPSVFGAIMSPMMFDAPNLEKSNKTSILTCCMIALPISIIIAQVVSWIAYYKENYNLALKINILLVFDILIIFLVFVTVDQFIY